MEAQIKGNEEDVKQQLEKINMLIYKNYCSIQKLVVQTKNDNGRSRIDQSALTEISRRSRQMNLACIHEACHYLDKLSLDSFSTTFRMLFQIFTVTEDLFINNYMSYIKFYLHQNSYKKDNNKFVDLKAMATSAPKIQPMQLMKRGSNFMQNVPGKVSSFREGSRSSLHNRMTSQFKSSLEVKETYKMNKMAMFHQTSVDVEGDVDFAADEEEREKLRIKRMENRQKEVSKKVDKLLFIWNKTHNTEEFEKETVIFVF